MSDNENADKILNENPTPSKTEQEKIREQLEGKTLDQVIDEWLVEE